ncbi:predicted protein [Postia placenta Mad-698-R]|uniref:Uncharacterized protein n=1 Tax=Postia placenta MAD-698-R-SB12 TaxID=670580 RepID=A0A1X6N6W1_9APHY|nr:hypothetical protein POSPLADRAFT_1137160 [Postia placenta MAD-698-R-SB12]EED85590.1 predicted protein [Postia placenta Mad-698-R]OSX64368.1 hypothetical protein POSPLADRAFT_1137160 [Postia placenta MAD-698-R-SB12]
MSSGPLGQSSALSVCAQASIAATKTLYIGDQDLLWLDVDPSVSPSDDWFTENFPAPREGSPLANARGPVFGGSCVQETHTGYKHTAIAGIHSHIEIFIPRSYSPSLVYPSRTAHCWDVSAQDVHNMYEATDPWIAVGLGGPSSPVDIGSQGYKMSLGSMVTCYAQGTPYTVHTPAAATSYHRVPSTTGFSTGDLSCSGSPESPSSFLSPSPLDSSSSYSSCSPSSSYTSPYTPNSSNVGRELPARRSSVQKTTRKTPYSRKLPNSRRRTSRSSSSSSSTESLLPSGKRRLAPPRNKQATVDVAAFVDGGSAECPICSHVPAEGSPAALRRHLETHDCTLSTKEWVCCGVPEEMSGMYKMEEPVRRVLHKGLWMVGGCDGLFSRKDALRRHLKEHKKGCAGDVVYGDISGWFDKPFDVSSGC